MALEYQSILENHTWDLVETQPHVQPISAYCTMGIHLSHHWTSSTSRVAYISPRRHHGLLQRLPSRGCLHVLATRLDQARNGALSVQTKTIAIWSQTKPPVCGTIG